MPRRTVLRAILAVAVVVVASPGPAAAWRHGWARSGGFHAGYPLGRAPWLLFPAPAPRPGYRFSLPPDAPLSLDDPESGTTYCFSPSTGFYFVCGYVASRPGAPLPVAPLSAPPVPGLGPSTGSPAAGILVFELPPGSQALVDGVPTGLSDGLGVVSVRPGRHRVVLRVSGAEAEHMVDVASQQLFTVTPTAILPSAP